MPRYFFNVYDDRKLIDEEGTVLPNWRVAQAVAIRYAGELLQSEAERLKAGEDWHLEVTDETGLILFRLDFSLNASSALAHIDFKGE